MDPQTLIAIIAALFTALIGFVLLGGGSGGSSGRVNKRVAQIGTGNQGDKKSLFSFMRVEDQSNRRKQIEESLGEIEKKQKDRKKQNKTLKSRLIQANWSMQPQTFLIICLVLAAVAGIVPMMFNLSPIFCAGVAFAFGFGLPRWILNFAIGRRQKKFTSHFADAMEIIVRGVRTGLPLGDCLKIIAHESPEPLRSEFRLVVEGESVGVPIEVCLERMYERMPLSEVNFFSTVLNIQRSTGGNLGESLSNLASVLRGRKLLREKIKALSAEARMSAVIIGALPIVVGVLVTIASPDYMTELYTTPTGHRNLMIGAGMMVIGMATMKKMINFKF